MLYQILQWYLKIGAKCSPRQISPFHYRTFLIFPSPVCVTTRCLPLLPLHFEVLHAHVPVDLHGQLCLHAFAACAQEGSHSSHGSNPSTTGSRDASPPDVHDKDNEMVANQDFARRHSPFELREARDISSKGVTRDDSGSLLTLSVVQSHHASVPHAPGQRGSSRSPRPGPLNTSPRPPDVRDKDADKDTEVVAMRDLARRHSPLELQDISSKGVTREDSGSFLGISVVQSRRASAPHAPSQRASSRSPRPGPMYRSSSIHDSP